MGQKDVYSVEEYKDLLRNTSSLERAFDYQLAVLGNDLPSPKPEYEFHPDRDWAFDRAWPEFKVAVELDGGAHGITIRCHNCKVEVRAMRNDGTPGKRIRISGWHARPSRFLSDKNKLNEAQRLGWIVIRLSNEDVNGDPFKMVNYLREILNKRSHLVKMVESLSSREVTIIHHIAGGFVTKEIASRLEISPATVRSHAQKICHKLNVPNRSAAVARAAAWGIIAFDEIPWAEDPYSFHE